MSSNWPAPAEHPTLKPRIVHVWSLALDLPHNTIDGLRMNLADDELARAARYKFDRHRRRFIACRGQVRQILANYLGTDASRLSFQYGPKGKPALAAPWSESGVEYNVSHSHERALCAVALNHELGVDVEHLRTPYDFEGIAAQFFAAEEVAALRELSDSARLTAFFACWTQKEAVLKAVGAGLSIPLNQVVVSLAPQQPAVIRNFLDASGQSTDWWMQNLEPFPGYVGAIASQGSSLEMACWQFPVGNG
ncbi:MAG TPA: 4'-phosphopantetheinyl transferase superfamily protein [Planctomycetaceae bacterium]